MTFIRRSSGDRTKPIIAVYRCPIHGEFDAVVVRDENGEAPDIVRCSETNDGILFCDLPSFWAPSRTVGCRVRRVEAVKGKWEKPERETYLDTRELGEGMDIEEWQAKRAAIWERKRQEDVMKIKRGLE